MSGQSGNDIFASLLAAALKATRGDYSITFGRFTGQRIGLALGLSDFVFLSVPNAYLGTAV